MKKEYVLTVLTTLLSIQLVLSQTPLIERSTESMKRAFSSIFAPILGTGPGEFLFAKILLFFLLFSIIFMSLKKTDLFGGNAAAEVIVTIIVSILSVRYIRPGAFMEAILLPYTALGIAISIFLPLIIFFYFLHYSEIGGFGRRMGWFIYGTVFLVFWLSRKYDTLRDANWIYILGFAFVLINLLFDKSIHRYLGSFEHTEAANEIRERAIADWMQQLKMAEESGNDRRARKIRRKLKRKYGVKS